MLGDYLTFSRTFGIRRFSNDSFAMLLNRLHATVFESSAYQFELKSFKRQFDNNEDKVKKKLITKTALHRGSLNPFAVT